MWFLAIFVCFACCALLMPTVKRLAWKMGAVDVPCDWRRMHTDCIPRNGGMAICFSLLVSCLLFCRHTPQVLFGMVGGLILFAVGLVDDVLPLPAWLKLILQLFAAGLSVFLTYELRGITLLLAILWVVALSNAHNFVDGLDGLFGGTAAIEGVSLALLYLAEGQPELALPPLLLSAACGGFLLYNRPPASVFAGDCGSGSIGFLLGFWSLSAFSALPTIPAAWSPVLIFAYPLTDLTTAVLRRLLRGNSPFLPDRAHLHHRICAIGISRTHCTVILLLLSASLCAIGVCMHRLQTLLYAIGMIAVTLLLMLGIRSFLLHYNEPSELH